MAERKNPTAVEAVMATISGRRMDFLAPDPKAIHLPDIAHALGMQCRYNGHVRRFYSVAEHSRMVARLVTYRIGQQLPREVAGAVVLALLHDASEAYHGDFVTPLKIAVQGVRAVEVRVEMAVVKRFKLANWVKSYGKLVKQCDSDLFFHESVHLRGWSRDDFVRVGLTPPDLDAVALFAGSFDCDPPEVAGQRWLQAVNNAFDALEAYDADDYR